MRNSLVARQNVLRHLNRPDEIKILKKLMIVGLLAAGILTCCPQVAPMVYQAFNPPMVQPPAPGFAAAGGEVFGQGGRPGL